MRSPKTPQRTKVGGRTATVGQGGKSTGKGSYWCMMGRTRSRRAEPARTQDGRACGRFLRLCHESGCERKIWETCMQPTMQEEEKEEEEEEEEEEEDEDEEEKEEEGEEEMETEFGARSFRGFHLRALINFDGDK
ncbi:hypothetical protein CAPTEDRAFT_213272 [Capitella teleta]|uniref:Uncharacterized protein n=1 Tax=Capitella teleta TaxID=283909 RepID=R7UY51_CAPTE|nr:hypothetical protein CAPTEDRAFT_213272 [Capitella teleta]|eukprot:ELU08366.1 hypothetical protein CAPTEDRAFT_213272 [Capitella teleta]